MGKKEICHACKKVKKPYVVIMTNDAFSFIEYEQAREKGPICERCDNYYGMTGDFKDATKEEYEIAKKSAWFANMMLKWWERDQKMRYHIDEDLENEDLRSWEGIVSIAEWCREQLSKNTSSKRRRG